MKHLAKLAGARIKKGGLARGWNAWKDMVEQRHRMLRKLNATAQRLLRPKQVAVMRHWRGLWSHAQRRAAMSSRHARRPHSTLAQGTCMPRCIMRSRKLGACHLGTPPKRIRGPTRGHGEN